MVIPYIPLKMLAGSAMNVTRSIFTVLPWLQADASATIHWSARYDDGSTGCSFSDTTFLLTSVSRSVASVPSRAGNTGRWRRENAFHLLLRRATRGDGRDGI